MASLPQAAVPAPGRNGGDREGPARNMTDKNDPSGLRKALSGYGDADFSIFLRKAFIKAMGCSDNASGLADLGCYPVSPSNRR